MATKKPKKVIVTEAEELLLDQFVHVSTTRNLTGGEVSLAKTLMLVLLARQTVIDEIGISPFEGMARMGFQPGALRMAEIDEEEINEADG